LNSTCSGDFIGIDTFRLPNSTLLSNRFSRYNTVCSLINGSNRLDNTIPATVSPIRTSATTPAVHNQNFRLRISPPIPLQYGPVLQRGVKPRPDTKYTAKLPSQCPPS
jgi:hypothetical protein